MNLLKKGLALSSVVVLTTTFSLSTASVFAATSTPTASVSLSNIGVESSGHVSEAFTAQAHNLGSHPLYQFWINTLGAGWKLAQNYSSNNTYHTTTPTGTTLVAVYAINPSALSAHDYAAAKSAVDAVNIGGQVSLTLPSGPVEVGKSSTLVAQATNMTHPVYQLWIESPSGHWHASGNFQSSTDFPYKPTTAGTHHFAIFAKDVNAPNVASAKVSSSGTLTVTSASTASHILFGSALPFIPAGGSKTLTLTYVNSANNPVTNYSGTATVTLNSSGAFTMKTASGNISQGSTTVSVTNGKASIDLVAGNTTGANGTITVKTPLGSQSATLSVQPATTTAQVGYALFTASGSRISYAHPLTTTAYTPVSLMLRPVNVYGNPVAATFADNANVETTAIDPQVRGGVGAAFSTNLNYLKIGSTGTAVKYTSYNTQVSSTTQVLYANSANMAYAVIQTLTPSSGTALTTTTATTPNSSTAKVYETISGVKSNTTYQVSATPYDQDGNQIIGLIPGEIIGKVASVGIATNGTRTTPAMVSAASQNSQGQWLFHYTTGSSANATDTLRLQLNWMPTLIGPQSTSPTPQQAAPHTTLVTNAY